MARSARTHGQPTLTIVGKSKCCQGEVQLEVGCFIGASVSSPREVLWVMLTEGERVWTQCPWSKRRMTQSIGRSRSHGIVVHCKPFVRPELPDKAIRKSPMRSRARPRSNVEIGQPVTGRAPGQVRDCRSLGSVVTVARSMEVAVGFDDLDAETPGLGDRLAMSRLFRHVPTLCHSSSEEVSTASDDVLNVIDRFIPEESRFRYRHKQPLPDSQFDSVWLFIAI